MFDDRFAERHPERSSASPSSQRVVSSTKWSLLKRKRHAKINPSSSQISWNTILSAIHIFNPLVIDDVVYAHEVEDFKSNVSRIEEFIFVLHEHVTR
jgi:hypothetical protein